MAYEIKVPPVGESISEGTIAQWLKSDGDIVTKGENLVVLDTEKASQDLQADFSGRLKILIPAGSDVKIGAVIGQIDESGAAETGRDGNGNKPQPETVTPVAPSLKETEAVFPQGAPRAALQPLHIASPQPQPGMLQPSDQVPAQEAAAAEAEGRSPVAPAAGQDVASPQQAAAAKSAGFGNQATEDLTAKEAIAPAGDENQPTSREPMSRMRRTIAAHLLKARNETAMLTTFAEVDMSAVMALRVKHQEAFTRKHGIKLGFMSFFIKACSDGLLRYPLVNASIDGNEIVQHHYVNMAVAVSTERGLAVPVIRNVEKKSFAEIEKDLVDLATKAKSGRIPLDDLKGGTFTITNGGVFGSLMSTPLINPPQVAILGMHSIVEKAVVIEKKIEIRPMMYLALSYDHRLIDGKEAVQFLVHVRDRIAAPERLLLGL